MSLCVVLFVLELACEQNYPQHNNIQYFIPIFSYVQMIMDQLDIIGTLKNEEVKILSIDTYHLFPKAYAFLNELHGGITQL
jgi:hypothetical protein